MSFYSTHILPKYINLAMSDKDLEKQRKEVVCDTYGQVLEIGFGSGLNTLHYTNIEKLYALEPSSELIEIARENIGETTFPIEYIQASAEKIPLPDNSIDCVVSTWTLCSIPHPEVALKVVFRVLKNGGHFSFVEHGKSSSNLICKLQNLFTPLSKKIAGGCHLNRDIERLIVDTGFKIQKINKGARKFRPLNFTFSGSAIANKT